MNGGSLWNGKLKVERHYAVKRKGWKTMGEWRRKIKLMDGKSNGHILTYLRSKIKESEIYW